MYLSDFNFLNLKIKASIYLYIYVCLDTYLPVLLAWLDGVMCYFCIGVAVQELFEDLRRQRAVTVDT